MRKIITEKNNIITSNNEQIAQLNNRIENQKQDIELLHNVISVLKEIIIKEGLNFPEECTKVLEEISGNYGLNIRRGFKELPKMRLISNNETYMRKTISSNPKKKSNNEIKTSIQSRIRRRDFSYSKKLKLKKYNMFEKTISFNESSNIYKMKDENITIKGISQLNDLILKNHKESPKNINKKKNLPTPITKKDTANPISNKLSKMLQSGNLINTIIVKLFITIGIQFIK